LVRNLPYIQKGFNGFAYRTMILRSLLLIVLSLGMISAFAQSEGQPGSNLSYGTEQREGAGIKLHPNPTPDYLYVQLGDFEASNVSLTVHSIIGNELSPEVEPISDHEVRLTVKDFAPGYYFVSIRDNASQYRGVFKFLKR
jgi:hypothetical protein